MGKRNHHSVAILTATYLNQLVVEGDLEAHIAGTVAAQLEVELSQHQPAEVTPTFYDGSGQVAGEGLTDDLVAARLALDPAFDDADVVLVHLGLLMFEGGGRGRGGGGK